ncbi:TonB-dependent receptor [Salinibacter sp. 10B]|uniref:TonB-dependent receptor n=1 Tax=Salinibacter sp. 10B TaxID=1923971 RepID=UPI000CF4DB1B|nr:TonB-dependent receptor [Salinibacter sp. 10B]
MSSTCPSVRFVLAALASLLLGGLASCPSASAQAVALRGFVVDAETGQPLPGAHVVVRSLTTDASPQGTVADNNGYYHFAGLSPDRYTLRATFVGYRPIRDTLQLSGPEDPVTRTFELSPTEQALGEIVVTDAAGGATTQEAGRQRVAPADVGRIPTPSVSGDLASYLQSLPGVVSVGDRGGQLYVRGGTPDQNLVLMDGMQVYRPFHIIGFYSAFPQALISNAEVYAGGFPARYSGRLSSVIDVQMRGGNQEHVAAAVTASPFLTGVRAEGPLNNDGLSLLATARVSQIERTAPPLLGQAQPLKFTDQFAKLQNTTESGRCSLTGFHTYDRGSLAPASSDIFRWSNTVFGGRCVAFGSGSSALADVSVSSSYVKNAVGENSAPERWANLWDFATKVNVVKPFAGRSAIRSGFHLHYSEQEYALGEQFQGLQTADMNVISVNGYVSGTLSLGDRVDLRPGVAVTVPFDYGPTIEPRLRASWRPFGSNNQEVNAAMGLYRQTVVGLSDERDLGSSFMAWTPTPLDQGRPAAWHAILGWRQQIGDFGLTAEGYYKDLANLAVPIWSARARFTTELTGAEGTAWGLDLRGTFEHGRVYAYLGYGLSWTRYTASQDNFGTWFGTDIQAYHPPQDRRHELNTVLSVALSLFTIDLRWQMGSGLPYTKPFGFDVYVHQEDLQQTPRAFGTPRLLYEKPYDSRLPAYHRLDVSLERTFTGNFANLTAKAGAINLYDRQNLFYFDLFTQRRVNQLPLVPYVALKIEV